MSTAPETTGEFTELLKLDRLFLTYPPQPITPTETQTQDDPNID